MDYLKKGKEGVAVAAPVVLEFLKRFAKSLLAATPVAAGFAKTHWKNIAYTVLVVLYFYKPYWFAYAVILGLSVTYFIVLSSPGKPPQEKAHRRLIIWKALLFLVWSSLAVGFVALVLQDLQPIPNAARLKTNEWIGANLKRLMGVLFDAWALIGLIGIALMGANPVRWANSKRMLWGGSCLFLVLGYPLVRWIALPVGWIVGKINLNQDSYEAITLVYYLLNFGAQVLVPPIMFFGGVVAASLIAAMVSFVFGVIILPIVSVFNHLALFEQNLTIFRYQRNGLIAYIVQFAAWLRGEQLENLPDDSKGSRFATLKEITAQQNAKGVVFGHLEGSPLCLHTEKHVLLMASTRSGKGINLIIPHLLRTRSSVFCLDPKGENARATGRQRAALNDKVHYLDPFGITGKPQSRFNPLSRFTLETMEAESKALANALVLGERGVKDHWTASALQLVAAVIMHVFTSPNIPPKEKDLPMVRRLLLEKLNAVLKEMINSDVADGLLSRLALSFLLTPDKELGSIFSTAQRETEILDNPFIIKCLSASGAGDEVDFSSWRKGTMSVFLCLSAPKFPVFSRWLRLVLTSALDEMTDTLSPPPLPVCFMLDELATLGHMEPVENAVGLAAGYGIQLFSVFQDVAQMRDLYRGRWASFIGNAGVRAVFNLDDYESAEYWSKFMGGHVIETTSQQQDIYGLTQSQSKGEAVRPLMTPEEIMLQFAGKRRANGVLEEPEKMLVLPQGSRPIIADRVAYFDDRELKGLWDDPRGPVQRTTASTPQRVLSLVDNQEREQERLARERQEREAKERELQEKQQEQERQRLEALQRQQAEAARVAQEKEKREQREQERKRQEELTKSQAQGSKIISPDSVTMQPPDFAMTLQKAAQFLPDFQTAVTWYSAQGAKISRSGSGKITVRWPWGVEETFAAESEFVGAARRNMTKV